MLETSSVISLKIQKIKMSSAAVVIGALRINNADYFSLFNFHLTEHILFSGPSCSKLTMSLVNDSLKFTSNDTQIC